MQRRRSKASALISALFITAIAAMIAVALAAMQRLLIHNSVLVISADQTYVTLQGMQAWAKAVVETYATQWANTSQPLLRFYALKRQLPQQTINDMRISGFIDNEQGKFNLNNLLDAGVQPNFVALLMAVDQSISKQEASTIAAAITAWLTTDNSRYYLTLQPPYRASHQPMADISELRLVQGITPTIFTALEPYITALPLVLQTQASSQFLATPIDINAASAPVLLTVNPTLTLSQAQTIIDCRHRYRVFSDTQTFLTNCVQSMNLPDLQGITVQGQYFLVNGVAVTARHTVHLKTLLMTHMTKHNTLKATIEWQAFY